ncbi:MAG: maleylpyruvate isomerase family mycothiol-dependent enzyme [Acidimicrobiia bacterium]
MTARRDDAAVEELLGAYALDACDPDEVAAVEALLARRPDLAAEATELANAAVWIGASEALEAPSGLRDSLFSRARARRGDEALDPALRVYTASTARLEDTIATLEPGDFDEPTPNGLNARDLVVHLAAQESLLAQVIDASPVPEVTSEDVPTRTSELIEHFADRPIADAHDVWQRSVEATRTWAADQANRSATLPWLQFDLPRDNLLVARAFENWIHRDDLRRAIGRSTEVPPAAELFEMADLSVRTMPMALLATGHSRPGKLARVVLTGAGGGDWLVPMGGKVEGGAAPDVTVTADVVDWCLVAGERLDAGALPRTIEGDDSLADDLLAAATAFATL